MCIRDRLKIAQSKVANAQAALAGANTAVRQLETKWLPEMNQSLEQYRAAMAAAAGSKAYTDAQNAATQQGKVAFDQQTWGKVSPCLLYTSRCV